MAEQGRERILINGSNWDPIIDQFFDMPAYLGDPMDAITVSDASENVPALTIASSVGTGQDDLSDGDIIMTDYSVPTTVETTPEPHRDEDLLGLAYPQLFSATARYPEELPSSPEASNFQVPHPPSPGCQVLLSEPQPPKKPTRKVDAESTNRVRQAGACMACKIKRVKCGSENICSECERLCVKNGVINKHILCDRHTPYEILGSKMNRWDCVVTTPLPSGPFSDHERVEISARFIENGQILPLELPLLANTVRMPNGQQRWGIRHGDFDYKKTCDWALRRLKMEPASTFEGAMNRLLAACVDQKLLGSPPAPILAARVDQEPLRSPPEPSIFGFGDEASILVRPVRNCLENLLTIACMRGLKRWEIHIQPKSQGFRVNSSDLQSVHNYLQHHAAGIISKCEKDTLREIDKLLAPSDIRPKNQQVLWSAVNIATWVSLWQLILLYREVSTEMLSQSQAHIGSHHRGEDPRAKFRETTERLYNVTVVVMSNLFKTKKALQDLKSAGEKLFKDNNVLREAFETAWSAHSEFYDHFEAKLPSDELVRALIISKEKAVLKRK